MIEYREVLRIPSERIGVLIGKNGEVKKRIEEELGIKLEINSSTGQVTIICDEEVRDPAAPLKAKNIVMAIGRGFSPESAFLLFNDAYTLDIINLREIVGDSKASLIRVKGRVIGEKGKARRNIESMTNTKISVYGHTIGIIGEPEMVRIAREGIMKLIKGAMHSTAYRYISREVAKVKAQEMGLRIF